MFDPRSVRELRAIEELCRLSNVDATDMLNDPTCDLIEVGRRLRMIAAVRASLRPRIESAITR
jgi:hypothetical protein